MNTLLLLIYLLLTLYVSWKVNKRALKEIPPFTLPLVLLAKYGYAYFFLCIYTEYYGGGELTADAGRFFEESVILHNIFYESPSAFFTFIFGLNNEPEFINTYLSQTNHWNAGSQFLLNDSRNVMRSNALLLFISNGSVYIHFLLFSFASFLGGVDLYQFIKKKSNIPRTLLLFILLLAPSIAFWSSSIIKEPLLMLGLFIFIRGIFDELSLNKRLWRIILGGVLLVGFKPYVFIAVLVGLVFYFLFSRITKHFALNLLIYLVAGFSIMHFSGALKTMTHVISKQQEDFMNVRDGGLYLDAGENKYYYIYYNNRSKFDISGGKAVLKEKTGAMIMNINDNFNRRPMDLKNVGDTFDIKVQLTQAGSGIDVTPIKDRFHVMVKMVPEVLFNTFVRPLPHKHDTWLALPAFVENIIYLLGFVFAFLFFRRRTTRRENRILWSISISALAIALIVGWTTPVAGAIVRYIIPAQAILLIVILIKFDWTKFRKTLRSGKVQ